MKLWRDLRTDKAMHYSCVKQLWWGSPRGTIQGRPMMPSSLLCIVHDSRGEWSQCEEGAALFPVNVPAHVLQQPSCGSKREEMIQNFLAFPPSLLPECPSDP